MNYDQMKCKEIVADLNARAPFCPIHGSTKMTYADGTENYHDQKNPHYRCELWIGSGVCGHRLPLSAARVVAEQEV